MINYFNSESISALNLGYKYNDRSSIERFGKDNNAPFIKILGQTSQIDLAWQLIVKAFQQASVNFSFSSKLRLIWILPPILSCIDLRSELLNSGVQKLTQNYDQLAFAAKVVTTASSISLLVGGNYFFGGTMLAFIGLSYLQEKKILPRQLENIIEWSLLPANILSLINGDMLSKVQAFARVSWNLVNLIGPILIPFKEHLQPDSELDLIRSASSHSFNTNLKITAVENEVRVNPKHLKARAIPKYFTIKTASQFNENYFISILIDGINKNYKVKNNKTKLSKFKLENKLFFIVHLLAKIRLEHEKILNHLYLSSSSSSTYPCQKPYQPAATIEEKFNQIIHAINRMSKKEFKKKPLDPLYLDEMENSYSDDERMKAGFWTKFEKVFTKAQLETNSIQKWIEQLLSLQRICQQLQNEIHEDLTEQDREAFNKLLSKHHVSSQADYINELPQVWLSYRKLWLEFEAKASLIIKNKQKPLIYLQVLGILQNAREKFLSQYIDNLLTINDGADVVTKEARYNIRAVFETALGLSESNECNASSIDLGYIVSRIFINQMQNVNPFSEPYRNISSIITALSNGRIPLNYLIEWHGLNECPEIISQLNAELRKLPLIINKEDFEEEFSNLSFQHSFMLDIVIKNQQEKVQKTQLYQYVKQMLIQMDVLASSQDLLN